MTKQEELAVTWRSGTAEGATDYLPLEDFLRDGTKRRCKHRVTEGAWQDWAWYDAEITGRRALLDYRPYAKLNDANGMELGVLRITFDDDERTAISTYEWQEDGSRQFEPVTITQVVPQPSQIAAYRPVKTSTKAQKRTVKPRPGQIRFKRRLMLAYGGRCCVTGCDVREALDGAHIDPYQNDSQDHPSNGLLLRKGLTRTVRFTPACHRARYPACGVRRPMSRVPRL